MFLKREGAWGLPACVNKDHFLKAYKETLSGGEGPKPRAWPLCKVDRNKSQKLNPAPFWGAILKITITGTIPS